MSIHLSRRFGAALAALAFALALQGAALGFKAHTTKEGDDYAVA
jgi:hypothetical protein